jgi:hypothetical protein
MIQEFVWTHCYKTKRPVPKTKDEFRTLSGNHYLSKDTIVFLIKNEIDADLSSTFAKTDSVINIGFCTKRQSWVAWSHRAWTEFSVGQVIHTKSGQKELLTLTDCKKEAVKYANKYA